MKNLYLYIATLLYVNLPIIAFAQETQVATKDDMNLLKNPMFTGVIDLALMATAAYRVYIYFVDFKPNKAFIEIIPVAMTIFMAFQWRVVLKWFGWFGV